MIGNGKPGRPGRTWKVGALARATGLTVRTLHYYDQIGLLQPSARLTGGHRLYDATWKSDDGFTEYREVRAGEQMIGLHPAGANGYRSPRSVNAVTSTTVISVDDTDAHYSRTVAAGAQIVCEPVDRPYGIREYGASDPEGQIWWFQSALG